MLWIFIRLGLVFCKSSLRRFGIDYHSFWILGGLGLGFRVLGKFWEWGSGLAGLMVRVLRVEDEWVKWGFGGWFGFCSWFQRWFSYLLRKCVHVFCKEKMLKNNKFIILVSFFKSILQETIPFEDMLKFHLFLFHPY